MMTNQTQPSLVERLRIYANNSHIPVSESFLLAAAERLEQLERQLAAQATHAAPVELTFDQIEDAFPEEGIYSADGGWTKVSAQWIHDFAHNIARIAAAQPAVPDAPTDEQMLDAIQAMADEGWLLCGPEGLSPAQEKVVAILAQRAAPQAQGDKNEQ